MVDVERDAAQALVRNMSSALARPMSAENRVRASSSLSDTGDATLTMTGAWGWLRQGPGVKADGGNERSTTLDIGELDIFRRMQEALSNPATSKLSGQQYSYEEDKVQE